MDRHHTGKGPAPEYRLSPASAREVAERAGPRRVAPRFLSTDHLSSEAVAAYVDARLPDAGRVRADAHLARCPQCRREVDDQREARRALRGSGPIRMPQELLHRLRSLEQGDVPAPAAPQERSSRWARLLHRFRRRDH